MRIKHTPASAASFYPLVTFCSSRPIQSTHLFAAVACSLSSTLSFWAWCRPFVGCAISGQPEDPPSLTHHRRHHINLDFT
ncbi:hypothetical protein K461DRAFT_86552 [Myriangium duriaei CBS 260.36]|uniref:Uncharacterized protein n=1 Tax=Myriangium duriaei CBS 260.36 TaxID=1168546 RepID=A0A9P4MII1_9PEZI|nr:hypothetical protein K461DRAFT_86552 [Myriangium duriaei CBS 260.36]